MNARSPGTADGTVRFLLFRVDDRLLHGQVSLGWGGPLGARGFLLADDALAGDAGAALLYEAAAPEGALVRIAALSDAARRARDGAVPPERTILLVRGLRAAAALLRAGVPGPVNLGGMHHRPGAREVLPYLFLTPEDRALLRELASEGHRFFAQDLPGNPRHELEGLLASDAGGEPAGGDDR